MSDLNLFLAENEDFKIVQVNFTKDATKSYHYKTMLNVEEGDFVVVDTPNNGYQVVEVIEVIPGQECELTFNFNLKWIVQKVETEQYEAAKKMERDAIKVLNKAKYARRRSEMIEDLKDNIGEDAIETVKGLVRL